MTERTHKSNGLNTAIENEATSEIAARYFGFFPTPCKDIAGGKLKQGEG